MKIKIIWQVDDGYCGGSRPQTLIFDTDDYTDNIEEWEALPEEKKQEYKTEAVEADYESNIHWSISSETIISK